MFYSFTLCCYRLIRNYADIKIFISVVKLYVTYIVTLSTWNISPEVNTQVLSVEYDQSSLTDRPFEFL